MMSIDFETTFFKNFIFIIRCRNIKGGLSLKIKKLHIYLYFIATKYLSNTCNALVKYIDN